MRPRFYANLIVAIMVAVGLVAAPAARAAELPKLVVNLGPDAFYYMLHFVADGAGYFAKQGVAIDLVTVNSGSRQVATVMGGSSDAAEVNFSVGVLAGMQGAELTSIASVYRIFPHVLFLSNDAIKRTGITDGMSIEDKVKRLQGLKIGITSPGSGTDQLMRAMFIGRGMDPDKQVTLLPLGGGPPLMAALKQRAIDGFVFTAPLPEAATGEGLGKIVLSPFEGQVPEMKGLTYMSILVSRDALKMKQPQLLAFIKALAAARKLISEDPLTARKYTRTHFADMDEGVFNAAFTNAVKGLPDVLEIQPAELERTLVLINMLDKNAKASAKFEDAVFTDFARQADKEFLAR